MKGLHGVALWLHRLKQPVALGCVLLILVLGFLARDAEHHHALHEDAAAPEHACAITCFVWGLDLLDLDAFSLVPCALLLEGKTPQLIECSATRRQFLQPPGRAPPLGVVS